MSHSGVLRALVDTGLPRAFALTAPDRPALSYRELRARLQETANALSSLGLDPGDCIAVMLPNGPETALLFLTIAAELEATAAPLNPAYRCAELELYLADLRPRALILDAAMTESSSEPMKAAGKLGIPVIRLQTRTDRSAGVFDLEPVSGFPLRGTPTRNANAPALFLHTSGTTSRPKLVPLTQRNLFVSAMNIIRTLGLRPDDCALNVMPLFHIHGLVASVMASLGSGGSVCCSPGFNALQFFKWLEASRATWYTAVPSMHQAILARAGQHAELVKNSRLRFVRSCSSTLPVAVWQELERTFGVPVVNAYGMTEGSHQISCTLPGDPSAMGTVGKGSATEIALLDGEGRMVPAGSTGEVAIRGDAVTAGYHDNPQANSASFSDGWLRTGDLGVLDACGNLTLLGRLKEIINSAGEKISPFEIEEALLAHPAVSAAIAFSIPSSRLGEAPGGAVVLAEGVEAASEEIRTFVRARLAPFKVPRQILILPEIPKGPTGKPQRIGMAASLGLAQPD